VKNFQKYHGEANKDMKNPETNNISNVGVFYHLDTLLHCNEFEHVERPERLTSILDRFKSSQLLQRCKVYDNFEEIDLKLVADIHGEDYVKYVDNLKKNLKKGETVSGDTYYNEHTFRAARLAANALVLAVDEIFNNKIERAFGVTRPPGHHAAAPDNEIKGFCIYNNVAVAAQYAMKKYGVKRILIFDWDAHYGDSTAKLFYDNPNVLYISIHRFDQGFFFPGTGKLESLGSGKGEGFNLNCTWNLPNTLTTIGDDEYVYAFERIFWPIMKKFNPEMVFISAGFDSGRCDPLGGIDLTPDGYAYMTSRLMQLAPQKTIVALEGGYNLETISESSEACLRILLGEEMPLACSENFYSLEEMKENCSPNKIAVEQVAEVVRAFEKYWPVLKDKYLLDFEKRVLSNPKKLAWPLTGSHPEKFIFKDDLIHKRIADEEEDFYHFFRYGTGEYKSENEIIRDLTAACKSFRTINNENYVGLENLVFRHPKASVLDLQFGKSVNVVDLEPEATPLADANLKSWGFFVSGLLTRDKKGKITSYLRGEEANKEFQEIKIKESIIRVLQSNGQKEINPKAVIYFMDYTKKLLDFLSSSSRTWKGSSVIFIVDNTTEYYKAAWISIGNCVPISEESPDALLFGVRNLSNALEKIYKEASKHSTLKSTKPV